MIDIDYKGFLIKLKRFPNQFQWLVTVRDNQNNTVAAEWLDTQYLAEQWAKNIIENIYVTPGATPRRP